MVLPDEKPKNKEVQLYSQKQLNFARLICAVLGFVAGMIIMGVIMMPKTSLPVQPQAHCTQEEPGDWLTTELKVAEGGILYYEGPDLSKQVCANEALTYLSKGQWVWATWIGYRDGRNMWQIMPSLDFKWYKNQGAYPSGAVEGTSSR